MTLVVLVLRARPECLEWKETVVEQQASWEHSMWPLKMASKTPFTVCCALPKIVWVHWPRDPMTFTPCTVEKQLRSTILTLKEGWCCQMGCPMLLGILAVTLSWTWPPLLVLKVFPPESTMPAI